MFLLFILIVVIVGIGLWLMGIYNKLQAMMQNIREQLSNLQAALKKRIDLANQIVDIARGYGEHEKLTYMSISQGNSALSQIQVLAQDYPQLKANQTYQTLMDKLEDLENLILSRRESYNAKVREYNSFRNRFPAVLIASKLSFDIAPYYEMEDPDFMEKVKVFERDDTEALQTLVQNSSRAIGEKMSDTQAKLKHKLEEGQSFIKNTADNYRAKQQGEQNTAEAEKTDETVSKPSEATDTQTDADNSTQDVKKD